MNNFGNVAALSYESLITLIANLDENLESVKQLSLIIPSTYGWWVKTHERGMFLFFSLRYGLDLIINQDFSQLILGVCMHGCKNKVFN